MPPTTVLHNPTQPQSLDQQKLLNTAIGSGLLKRAHTFSHSNTLPPPNNVKSTWTISALRPLPPTISNLESIQCLHTNKRKPTTFEEDALILKVVEAYCAAPKPRNTINSGKLILLYFFY